MKRQNLRGKLVSRCSGNNAKADGKATSTKKQKASLELVVPVAPESPPVYLTHTCQPYRSSVPGECEISLELENEGDADEESDPMVTLYMRWTGAYDSPDAWEIHWFHYLQYLGMILPEYLRDYSPAPEQMLNQLVFGLELKYAAYFGDWKASLKK